MTPSTRILIVDDHASVRDGLRAFLERETSFNVCGEAADGVSAIKQAQLLKPDLIILDLALPKLNGVEAASVLKSELPAVKIVAFSMFASELGRTIKSAARIDAVISKSSSLTVLSDAIRNLQQNRPVRRYTRYAFSADAAIIDHERDQIPAHVTDISFGGCRLFAIGQFRLGAEVTIKIRIATDRFQATARVAHCTATDVGVMWGDISPESLFVLQKWIQEAMQVTIDQI